MRFNSKELVQIAESGVVDKEGVLLMKYKPEGRIFKKEESKIIHFIKYLYMYCKSTLMHGYQFLWIREETQVRGFLNLWF